jgi:hypothetical protein
MGQRVKEMVEHVGKAISRLLGSLRYLYDANGISFSVDGLHGILMRILTPYELLSHFHVVDNSRLIKGGTQTPHKGANGRSGECSKELWCKYRVKYQNLLERYNDREMGSRTSSRVTVAERCSEGMRKEEEMRTALEEKERKINEGQGLENSSINATAKNQKQDRPSFETKTSAAQQQKPASQKPKQLSNGKPLLGQTIEKQLALWIIDELCLNNKVKMNHIADKAK